MYHLRLYKGRSYCGVVSATKEKPDVFVEDKATAYAAVASGYFHLVADDKGGADSGPAITGHLDREQLEDMKADDLNRLAKDMGIETKGLKKGQIIDAIANEEITVDANGENLPDYGEEN